VELNRVILDKVELRIIVG